MKKKKHTISRPNLESLLNDLNNTYSELRLVSVMYDLKSKSYIAFLEED